MIKNIYTFIKKKGVVEFCLFFLIRLSAFLLALPIAAFIFLLSPWVKIRFIRLFSYRIGHYALNTELLLCALNQKLFPESNKVIYLYYTVPGEPICNYQLHKMWQRVLTILPFPYFIQQIDRFLLAWSKEYGTDSYKTLFETPDGAQDKWGYLATQESHLRFTQQEEYRGQELLHQLGIPSGAPFICLLGRDANYLKTQLPGTDWSYHEYRNVDINNYQLAMQFLTDAGYFVIRMGKNVKDKINFSHPGVIDYANHSLQSDFLDIYLSAKCFFFISPRSGIDAVAQIFRRPLLVTDFPLCDFIALYALDLFIPKKVLDLKSQNFLPFSSMCWELDRLTMMQTLQQRQWVFVNNTAEEILAVTKEMVGRLTHTWVESADSVNLQARFWQTVPEQVENYSYRNKPMRIGESFIQTYHLLAH